MHRITTLKTGILYRNPTPHVRSVHAYFPSVAVLPDGERLATAWAYDDDAKTDRPNPYAISADGGKSCSVPASTGLRAQTLTPLELDDGRILSRGHFDEDS